MNDEIVFLVTLLRDGALRRLTIKLKNSQISDDLIEYPMEPDNRQELRSHLPPYLQDGEVVELVEVYDSIDARPQEEEEAPREEPTLAIIQREQKEWALKNFGEQPPHRALLGAVEELRELVEADPSSPDHILELIKALGRLSHSQLKGEQGIRVNKDHRALAKDAVADMVIFLVSYCNDKDFDLEDIVRDTWDEVKQRDWRKNPKTGMPTAVVGEPVSYRDFCIANPGKINPMEMRFTYIMEYLPSFPKFQLALDQVVAERGGN